VRSFARPDPLARVTIPGTERAREGDVAHSRIRIYLGDGHTVGPGKAQLLEAIRELGSISAAARSMNMAYRHAWDLIDDMNQCFRSPVVTGTTGGRAGGGATLTPFGEEVVRRFRAMEKRSRAAISRDLAALEREVAGAGTAAKRPGPAARRSPAKSR
jgi:molybdate transport system regulatory protein